MKLKFIDWEIEKHHMEDFQGYKHRYDLTEIVGEEGPMCLAKTIVSTNNIKEVYRAIGTKSLEISPGETVDFVENLSLKSVRWNRDKSNSDT